MKINSLKIDSTRVEQGAWIGGIPNMGELELKVRGFANADFQRVLAREQQAIGRDKRINGRIDPSTLDAIMSRCMADCILQNWRGLTDENDAPIPYGKDLAFKLLTDPDYRPFQEAVSWAANLVQEVQAERIEDAVGNSASA